MSDKPKYDNEVPWDRMSPWAVNLTAFIKGLGVTLLSLATGVLALFMAVSANKNSKDAMAQVVTLAESNNTLSRELSDARWELGKIQQEMQLKDEKIDALVSREKELLTRIEELEKQLKG